MNRIIVKSVKATNNKLIVDFSCSGQIKKFFNGNQFFAEYDVSIEAVPSAILIIPFLSTICPIAWANQTDIYVETVDETFLQSLETVRLALQKFYPQINFNNKIHVNKIVALNVNTQPKAMMLFSGGVDSLATYIRNKTEKPSLVAIHGADIALSENEGWKTVFEGLSTFSKNTGTTLRTVRSNFKELPDFLMLNIYRNKLGGGGWWQRVMFGFALSGLCAPLTYIEKVGRLYIAADWSEEFAKPSGSASEIVDNVKWAGTATSLDGFELCRQKKIQLIAEYIKTEYKDLFIRSCWISVKGDNCSKCEKCSRTILGLELAGINPNNHGFSIEADTFANIKKKLVNGKLIFGDDEQYMWTDLQHHAPYVGVFPHPEAEDLVNCLLNSDIRAVKSESIIESVMVFIFSFLKYMPYQMYVAIRSIVSKLYY